MLEKTITIASYDVFPSGALRPSALMKYMQQMAREDCDTIGCTYAEMRRLNTVFVSVRSGIEFYAPVNVGDTIKIVTFNNDISGITFDREFEIFRGDKEVAHASTFWVLVRFDTRALVRPNDFEYKFENHHRECGEVEVPKRIAVPENYEKVERVVRVSDLDENNHLNNCIYADIALDALKSFDGLTARVKKIVILYRHEARLGETLSLSVGEGESSAVVTAVRTSDGAPCFEAEVTFER